ncbi:MAG: hypothetical protein AAFQ80_05100 [Cyanobacteria bacterium J06621_8]
MIFFIIAVNLAITLLNIYIARRIWQLRSLIIRITAILVNYEGYFAILLQLTPNILETRRANVQHVRHRYQQFHLQSDRVRQLIWLMSQSYQIWRKIS